jgi:NFU1 iron-sulfur cluster scaffold homolog, mitochondrial
MLTDRKIGIVVKNGRLGVPFVVKEVQPTPNPNALKFVLDGMISVEPASFYNPAQAQANALAAKLMAIPGVDNVMLLGDFVTVGKQPKARWSDINPKVKQILATDG